VVTTGALSYVFFMPFRSQQYWRNQKLTLPPLWRRYYAMLATAAARQPMPTMTQGQIQTKYDFI